MFVFLKVRIAMTKVSSVNFSGTMKNLELERAGEVINCCSTLRSARN